MTNNTTNAGVHFTDTERIAAYSTGDAWSEWGPTRVISMNDIAKFADLTDNHQWIHDDPLRCARESPYGGLIAHGLLLVSLIPGLLPDEGFALIGYNVRIVRAIDNLRLPSPVYPDETVRVHVRHLRAYIAPSGRGTIIEREIEVWSLHGEKPAVSCTLKLQYM